MRRFPQYVFCGSLVALSWLLMMAIHELGHVMGAFFSGGTVAKVVLHPLAISRTDVSPNPHPAIVVWLGPLVGCLAPLAVSFLVPSRYATARNTATFFAGFCLIANGAYISCGSFTGVGDCAEMLRTGSPQWTLIAFGAVTTILGLWLWHCLGSLAEFVRDPSRVTNSLAAAAFAARITTVAVELLLWA